MPRPGAGMHTTPHVAVTRQTMNPMQLFLHWVWPHRPSVLETLQHPWIRSRERNKSVRDLADNSSRRLGTQRLNSGGCAEACARSHIPDCMPSTPWNPLPCTHTGLSPALAPREQDQALLLRVVEDGE